jgi:glycosyltransferase involved in cell wall biosynthesis
MSRRNKCDWEIIYFTTVDLNVPSGERTHIVNAVSELSTRCKVTLICSRFDEQGQERLSVKEILSSNYRIGVLNKLNAIGLLMKRVNRAKHKSDLLLYIRESFYAFLLPFLLKFSGSHKIKVVVEVNGIMQMELKIKGFPGVIIGLLSYMQFKLLQRADIIIAVSEGIKNKLLEDYKIDPSKVYIIGNGADIETFRPIERDLALLKVGLESKFKYIGYIGWLTQWQKLDVIIEAFLLLLSEVENVRLLIVGEGPQKKSLEERIKSLGLEKHIILIGKVPYSEVINFINILSIGIIPDSRINEGRLLSSPIKLWEYLACGVPVIIPYSEDLIFIEQKRVGVLLSKLDVKEISESIKKVFKLEEKEIQAMRIQAVKLARENSWRKKILQLIEILNSIQKQKAVANES